MRTLRVAFRDLPPGCGPEWFFRRHPAWMADQRFELSSRPQLVIHGAWPGGRAAESTPPIDAPCLRLFYGVDGARTDLSRTDFALGFERELASERFLRSPAWVAAQQAAGFDPD
ncbi:MAG: hypothetical protein AAFZ65_05085, partial [Planctomycetota bacterium]